MNTKLKEILVEEIRKKKEFQGLSFEYVEKKLFEQLRRNQSLHNTLNSIEEIDEKRILKKKEIKQTVKIVREEIGIVYGSFLTNKFQKIFLGKDKEIEELLTLHKSTRERIEFYAEIYEHIFSWYKPKHIVDLACGLNPLSYPLMKVTPTYTAVDLNEKDMEFVQKFFNQNSIEGEAFAFDVTDENLLENQRIQQADLIFLFKALDSVEHVKRHYSKALITNLPAKRIVVSFPTKSLVAKEQFDVKKRNWLLKFLDKESINYKTFEVENELFILITKN